MCSLFLFCYINILASLGSNTRYGYKMKNSALRHCSLLAERVGFEPTVRLPAHTLSRRASSTTPAPLL